MMLIELLVAVVVALALSWAFVGGLGWRRPGTTKDQGLASAMVFFFLLVFAASWAGGSWMRPIGPAWYGVSWLGFVLVGLVTALLVSTASRPLYPKLPEEPGPRGWLAGIGALFWVLLLALLIAGITAAFDPVLV